MDEYPTTMKDVYRLANLLLERHGDGAVFISAKIAEELRDQGNYDGQAAWKLVVKAVNDLIDDVPPENGGIH